MNKNDLFKLQSEKGTELVRIIETEQDNKSKYYLHNIILGILGKTGGIPWIVKDMPGNVDCFVGLDIATVFLCKTASYIRKCKLSIRNLCGIMISVLIGIVY